MPLPADRATDYPDLPQEQDQPHQQDSLARRLQTLPDGHPSSPNNEDGTRRAPTVNLRDLELPLDDSPEPTKQTETDAWREQLPALQSLWDRHLERWPTQDKPPVDRSTDETGSWRGDSGLYLDARENEIAGTAFDRIRGAEHELTNAMKAIELETPDARLTGLENRLKSEDRCKEKIASEAQEKIDLSASEITVIAEKMHDAVRYTFLLPSEQYANGQHQVRQKLEEKGYELVLSRDWWDNSQYKGINTRWSSPDAVIFEVQFHTQESFEGKQLTHGAYERLRSNTATQEERLELSEFQRTVSSFIAKPVGAHDFPDYRKEGY